MHDLARSLKAKTDTGAILVLDGEVLLNPRWLINKHTISIRCDNCRHVLMERGDDPYEIAAEMRPRLRAFVEA